MQLLQLFQPWYAPSLLRVFPEEHLPAHDKGGLQCPGSSRLAGPSSTPSVSADGRYVAFVSKADNLVPGDNNLMVDIFLHSRLTLMADTAFLPEVGGTINFTLDAGYDNASRSYLLLGSATGMAPGISLPGGLSTLPLNWDAFTSIVIALANTPVFSEFMGTLDASYSFQMFTASG